MDGLLDLWIHEIYNDDCVLGSDLGSVVYFRDNIMIMSMINSLKVFDQVSVATQGGPGTSSFVLVYAIYDYAFNRFEMGYASAIAWVLFIIILIFTLVQWKLQNKWVNYDM